MPGRGNSKCKGSEAVFELEERTLGKGNGPRRHWAHPKKRVQYNQAYHMLMCDFKLSFLLSEPQESEGQSGVQGGAFPNLRRGSKGLSPGGGQGLRQVCQVSDSLE